MLHLFYSLKLKESCNEITSYRVCGLIQPFLFYTDPRSLVTSQLVTTSSTIACWRPKSSQDSNVLSKSSLARLTPALCPSLRGDEHARRGTAMIDVSLFWVNVPLMSWLLIKNVFPRSIFCSVLTLTNDNCFPMRVSFSGYSIRLWDCPWQPHTPLRKDSLSRAWTTFSLTSLTCSSVWEKSREEEKTLFIAILVGKVTLWYTWIAKH